MGGVPSEADRGTDVWIIMIAHWQKSEVGGCDMGQHWCSN